MGPLATQASRLSCRVRSPLLSLPVLRSSSISFPIHTRRSSAWCGRDQIGPAINDLFTRSEHPPRAEPNPKLGAHDNSMAPDPQPEPSRFWGRRQDRAQRLRRDGGTKIPDVGKFQTPARLLPHCARLEAQSPPLSLATSALRWPSSSGSEFPSLAVTTCLPKTGILHRCPRSIHSVLTDVLDGSGRRIPGAILLFGDGSKKSGSTVPKGRSHVRPPRYPPGAIAAKGTHLRAGVKRPTPTASPAVLR